MMHSIQFAWVASKHIPVVRRYFSVSPVKGGFYTRVAISRRRLASIAVIVAATSGTAVAAVSSDQEDSHGKSTTTNINSINGVSSALRSAACEAQAEVEQSVKDDFIFPDFLLKYDHYNGIIVHLDWLVTPSDSNTGANEPLTASAEENRLLQRLRQEWCDDPQLFEAILRTSLQRWKEEGRRGIWVEIPSSMAQMIPICIKLGFDFHSCQSAANANHSGQTNLIVSQWLPDSASRLPLGPYFQAGVGCVVFDPQDPNKMLVVQEVTGPAAARELWKMPTGLIDPGEDIAEAALRELDEETGLKGATCEGILAFRQAHGAAAGRASSDLFFVCLLKLPKQSSSSALSENLKPQEHEIKDICWMPVQDYADQETWQKSPVYKQLNQVILGAAENRRKGIAIPLVVPHQLPVGFVAGTNTVYKSNL